MSISHEAESHALPFEGRRCARKTRANHKEIDTEPHRLGLQCRLLSLLDAMDEGDEEGASMRTSRTISTRPMATRTPRIRMRVAALVAAVLAVAAGVVATQLP